MIKEGDYIAEEIMYKKYSAVISKRIKDFNLNNEFDDIFQESLIVLARSIDTYIDSKIGFFPYFYRNLTNRLISIVRHKKSSRRVELIAVDEVLELKDPNIIINYKIEESKIFKGLTKEELNIINEIYVEKKSIKELSSLYGTKEDSIYYILRKAKDKIRKNCIDSDIFY